MVYCSLSSPFLHAFPSSHTQPATLPSPPSSHTHADLRSDIWNEKGHQTTGPSLSYPPVPCLSLPPSPSGLCLWAISMAHYLSGPVFTVVAFLVCFLALSSYKNGGGWWWNSPEPSTFIFLLQWNFPDKCLLLIGRGSHLSISQLLCVTPSLQLKP